MRVLIVGCGYVGLPLGAELAQQGHQVSGLRRSPGAANELAAVGIKPLVADITQPTELARLPAEYDWVVNCVASGGGGEDEYRAVYLRGTQNLLEWLAPAPPQKFVYTSSTSVYGQTDGSTVTETSPAEPVLETGKILVATERALLEAAQVKQFPAVVLRLAGIYGPARGYWLRQYLKGEAKMVGEGKRVLNQIHREDVIGAIIAALERGRSGSIYNVVDDEPVSQLALFQWLAGELDRALPPSVSEDQTTARKRGVTNKRVSNAKLKVELGYALKYPTFREGYRAELRHLGV
jgi:nucleoside-diphosphate-sugar epimerase